MSASLRILDFTKMMQSRSRFLFQVNTWKVCISSSSSSYISIVIEYDFSLTVSILLIVFMFDWQRCKNCDRQMEVPSMQAALIVMAMPTRLLIMMTTTREYMLMRYDA